MVKEKEKLIWLGLKRPNQTKSSFATEISKLKEHIGDFEEFQDFLDSIESHDELNTELVDNGFSESDADQLIQRIKNSFSDQNNSDTEFDEFETFVTDEGESYQELKSKFNSLASFGTELETEDGKQAAGVRTFENDGVTYDGVEAPAGSVEIFGKEVHFSSSVDSENNEDVKTGKGSGSTGDSSVFNVYDIEADTSGAINTAILGETVTISAYVDNEGDYAEVFTSTLVESGEVVDSKSFEIPAGETRALGFVVEEGEQVCHQYQISSSDTITVCWEPARLGL